MSIALRGIGKSFNGVSAVESVDLELHPGEAHALLGENGAGKTTLIKVMSGVHKPSVGSMLLDGTETLFSSPDDALHRGVSVVHQERHLVPDASIAENVFLGRLPTRWGMLDRRQLNRDAASWLDQVGLDVDCRRPASVLSSGQGQLVEIARALSRRARVLLLDEPTASIGEEEVQRLFDVLRRLKEEGTAILFVSHKLDEVDAICDRITVIRDGRDVISGQDLANVGRDHLVEAMVGREFVQSSFPPREVRDTVALELVGVSTAHGHRNVDLTVRAGEIVGVYGLVGAGRSELARAVVGLDRITGGEVRVNGELARIHNPRTALLRHRLCYISEDRKSEGLIVTDTIERNASMPLWTDLSGPLGHLPRRRLWPAVSPALLQVDLKMNDPRQTVATLSGGNQQKISAGKWLSTDAEVFLVDEPTVGIDIAAKAEVHRLLWDLAANGKGVVMISSDLREVVQLSDRILVMSHGRFVADLANTGDYAELSTEIMRTIVAGEQGGSSLVPVRERGSLGAS